MWSLVLGLTILHFAQARVFNNPLLDADARYPGITKYKDVYYAILTPGGVNTDLYVSTDLKNWTYKGNILNEENFPLWAASGYVLAPSPIQVINENNFRFFFQTVFNATARDVIAAATAMNIEGPYYVLEKPIIQNPSYSYGRPSTINSNGALYLVWASMDYDLIFSRKLLPDGIGFADEISTTLLNGTESWEESYLMGVSAYRRENYYYIFYGGHDNCLGNGIGVARSYDATGPYEKFSRNPFLVSTDRTVVAGQPNVVEDIDGSDAIIFQTITKTSGSCGSPRMAAATLNWDDDGWPYVTDLSLD